MLVQFLPRDPRKGGQGGGWVGRRPAVEKKEVQRTVIVGVRHLRVLANDLDLEARFFTTFADGRLFCRFPGFDLAAGKFPVTGQYLVLGTWAGQELVLVLYNGDGDLLDSRHGNRP